MKNKNIIYTTISLFILFSLPMSVYSEKKQTNNEVRRAYYDYLEQNAPSFFDTGEITPIDISMLAYFEYGISSFFVFDYDNDGVEDLFLCTDPYLMSMEDILENLKKDELGGGFYMLYSFENGEVVHRDSFGSDAIIDISTENGPVLLISSYAYEILIPGEPVGMFINMIDYVYEYEGEYFKKIEHIENGLRTYDEILISEEEFIEMTTGVPIKHHAANRRNLRKILLDNKPDIFINEEPYIFSISPLIKDDRMHIPLRELLEHMGAEIEWLGETGTIIIKYEEKVLKMKINQNDFFLNDAPYIFNGQVAPFIFNNKAYIPLRAILEVFDFEVEYDKETGITYIVKQ